MYRFVGRILWMRDTVPRDETPKKKYHPDVPPATLSSPLERKFAVGPSKYHRIRTQV